MLEDFLERHPAAASLTHFNILAELHLQQGRHQRVADVVRTAADTFGNQELPIDLQVGLGFGFGLRLAVPCSHAPTLPCSHDTSSSVEATADGACRPGSCVCHATKYLTPHARRRVSAGVHRVQARH